MLCFGNITLTEAMFEQAEGRKLSDAEAVAHIKKYPINCAKTGTGRNEDAVFTEWMFCAANHIVTKIASDPECVKILVALEGQYRLKSCLNSAAKLERLATKPNGRDARRWVFQCLWDRLQHKLLDNNEVSRNALVGDKHSCGLIVLFEWKKKLLGYLDTMMMKAKIADSDRTSIMEMMKDCPSMRHYSEKEVSWQAHLRPSGQEALRFLTDAVYLKVFDNLFLQSVKNPTTNCEVIEDLPSVTVPWPFIRICFVFLSTLVSVTRFLFQNDFFQ